uniref:Uncharacterized protein n=1 Tax=Arundo donax TaxID=35708 RepID=A0A0A9HZ68_ARUDO
MKRIYGEDRSTGEEVERCAAAATIKHLEDRLHLDIIDYTYNSFLAHKSDLLKIESMKMKYVGLACEVERAMKKNVQESEGCFQLPL